MAFQPDLSFLKDLPISRRSCVNSVIEPPVHSDWRAPKHLPNLKYAKRIAINTETRDPNIKRRGPGCFWNDGNIIGFCVAVDDWSAYIPIRHTKGENLLEGPVIDWMKETCSYENTEYIFANAQYDLGWLLRHGIEVKGIIRDIQILDFLNNEEQTSYSLNSIAKRHGFEPKREGGIETYARWMGINPKADMWQMPSSVVAEYAEYDAVLTLRIYEHLIARSDHIKKVFDLESKLTPHCMKMSYRGVRVDLNYAQELNDDWKKREKILRKDLGYIDEWSTAAICQLFDREGIVYPRTEKGNPSITKGYLGVQTHPVAKTLLELRSLNRCRKTYLEEGILKGHKNGRIHAQFLQTGKGDEGTKSGRFSSKNPNLQQIPKRSSIINSSLIRKCYIPEEGELWAKLDYSSQEPRMQVHYGVRDNDPEIRKSAEEARKAFHEGKKLYTFIEEASGGRIDYDQAKAVVLGRSYGMGKDTMSETLGVDEGECQQILADFDNFVPFIGGLSKKVCESAEKRGFIRTILGRRRHFNWWSDPSNKNAKPVYGYEEAIRHFGTGELKRAFTYRAYNALIQGSSADQTKLAMLMAAEQGFNLKMPVHDEINFSIANESEAKQLAHIMETALELEVESKADLDLGRSWC